MSKVFIPSMLMWLAAGAFVFSAVVHGFALAGEPLPLGRWVWLLHLGSLIAMAIPQSYNVDGMRHVSRWAYQQAFRAAVPVWMRVTSRVLLLNAAIQVGLLVYQGHGVASMAASPASLTATRAFTSVWLYFYASSIVSFYVRVKAPELYGSRLCPLGHASASTAYSCKVCGHVFAEEGEAR